MTKSSFYISLGIWIAILPFLGFPGVWKNILIALSGIFLALTGMGPMILKKLQTKSKISKRKKFPKDEEFVDNISNDSSDLGDLR